MDINDDNLQLEFENINSKMAVVRLEYRRMKLERLRVIESPDFNESELKSIEALLTLYGQNHE